MGVSLKVVTARVHVQLAQSLIVLQEGRHRASEGHSGIDRVAEISGITETVPGRERRRVGSGESREERVAVDEIHPLIAQPSQRRRGLRINDRRAQPIGNKENDVVGSGRGGANHRQRRKS